MTFPRHRLFRRGARLLVAAVLLLSFRLPAGLPPPPQPPEPDQIRSGRVLVVANSASAASMELAVQYRAHRGLPPMNLLLVSPSNPVTVSPAEFKSKILDPVRQRRAVLGETAIDYIVLCRDVPYRTATLSVPATLLFDGTDTVRPGHGYFAADHPFEACIPAQYQYLHPAAVISGYNVHEGLELIARGQVHYSSVREAGRFYFCEGLAERGMYRNPQIPAAIAALDRMGARCSRNPEPSLSQCDDILGQFTGATWINLQGNSYLPGAILDNLTSYGGYLLDNAGQVDLLSFVQAGVSGAYGTVSEPTNNPTRWADYSLPVRYAAGFGLMESYLQTILDWRFGLVVGDPLLAPFAKPPVIEWTRPAGETVPAGQTPKVHLKVTEGAPGQGIAWLEVWLNDQDRLAAFQPPVPAGVTASFVIRSEQTVLYARRLAVLKETPLPALLQQLAGTENVAGHQVEVLPAGKRQNKLLCRWRPAAGNPEAVRRTTATVVLQLASSGMPPRTMTFSQLLHPMPAFLPTLSLNLGKKLPQPGDALELKMGKNSATAVCELGETLESMNRKVGEALGRLPVFGPNSAFQTEWRPNLAPPGVEPPPPTLWIYPRQPDLGPFPPLDVTVRRTGTSGFATDLPARLEWRSGPAFPLAEAVIQPGWPVTKIDTDLALPLPRCSTGWNTVRAIAGGQSGAEAQEETSFTVAGTAAPPAFTIAESAPFRGDLDIRLDPGPAFAKAVPELLVDGRVITTLDAGATSASLRLVLPFLCPGAHQIQIQWLAAPSPRSPVKPFVPLARSAPRSLFIRHPLLEKIELTPTRVAAGAKVALRLRGPYLHDGLRIILNGRTYPLKRDPRVGLNWIVDAEPLPEGIYKLELTGGNPDRETAGLLPMVLLVTPPGAPGK